MDKWHLKEGNEQPVPATGERLRKTMILGVHSKVSRAKSRKALPKQKKHKKYCQGKQKHLQMQMILHHHDGCRWITGQGRGRAVLARIAYSAWLKLVIDLCQHFCLASSASSTPFLLRGKPGAKPEPSLWPQNCLPTCWNFGTIHPF